MADSKPRIDSDLREKRLKNEWKLLQEMAAVNPARIEHLRIEHDQYLFELRATPAPFRSADQIVIKDHHGVKLSFPRFFPAVPIELYLDEPALHPNVHPSTG